MYPNKFSHFVILLFLSFNGFCQEKLYLDENMKEIDIVSYSTKCKSYIFKCLEYKTDSLSINKILYKYSFGKISAIEYNQVRNLLNKDSGNNIKNTDIIIIRYLDSLSNYSTSKKNYEKHVAIHKYHQVEADTSRFHIKRKVRHQPFNKKKHSKNLKNWTKTQNKCIKKYEKKHNTKVIHAFKYGKKDLKNYPNFKFVKDRSVLKNTFFKIMYNYRYVVLKPDGEYFLSGGHLSDVKLKKLIKTENWLDFKKDLETTILKYPISGFGFFEKDTYHKTHCF